MRKLMFSLLAGAAGVLGATSAQASVTVCDGNLCPNVSTTNVLIDAQPNGATIHGATQGGTQVDFTSTSEGVSGLYGGANGQAVVGAVDGVLTQLTFTLLNGATFGYADFNLIPINDNDLKEFQTTTILLTYYDPLAGGPRTITVKANGQNFTGLFGDAGERFYRVDLISEDTELGWQELKQLRLGDIQTAAVPEPGTWAMMLLGFGAIGFGMRRRRKSLDHAMQIA